MRKRFLAIVLVLVMLIGIVPTTFALASLSSATLTVKANKTTVNPGDEVEFSVELSQTGDIAAIEAYVKLPTGMTLVEGSFAATTDKIALGWDDFTVNEEYLMIYGYGSRGYTGTPLTLATFKCVVDANAEGQLVVDLYDISALDSMMEDKYPVSVAEALNVEIPVTGVTLDKDALSLDTGDNKTATLTATVNPNEANNKAITWESSDKTVATVENGVVTAIKNGTTTITVKTVEGNFTDVCVVIVTCAHTEKTLTAAKAANCQEGGWNAYHTCDTCGQLFAADGITKINAIPTTGKDSSNHTNIKFFAADTATCVHMGNDAYEKCVDCGVVTSGSDIKFYGEHNYGELKDAIAENHTPDTLTPSVSAHYQCSVCQKYFTEEKVETTLEALTGTTPSHSYGDWINTDDEQHWKQCGCGNMIEVAEHKYDNSCDTTCNICGHVRNITHTWSSDWSDDGTNHWKECTVCHNARTDEGTHTGGTATCQTKKECSVCYLTYGNFEACDYIENHDAKYCISEATCVAEAVYTKSCSVCGTAHATDTFKYGTVDVTNHVGDTYVEGQCESDCMNPGYTGDTWCKDCNTKIKDGELIPAGHKTIEVPENAATHESAGNIKYYTCSGCDLLFADAEAKTEIKLEDTIIPKSEHSYGEWVNTDAENHWKECDCGDKIEIAVHTYGDWTVTKESTTTESGLKEKTCSVCGHKVTEELPLAENTNEDISSPQTGDNTNILLWLVLFMISACGMLVVPLINRKRAR